MNINELAKEVHQNAVALGVDVDAVVMAKHRYNLAAQGVEARRRGA